MASIKKWQASLYVYKIDQCLIKTTLGLWAKDLLELTHHIMLKNVNVFPARLGDILELSNLCESSGLTQNRY